MSRGNDLARRLMEGERGALARAIGVAENGGKDLGDLLRAVAPRTGRARVIGFTGAPGAGKSTLVSAVTAEYRKRGMTVGVVAVDPSSPLTGGAILGDRIRMGAHAEDSGVFVRSMASRGHLGGLAVGATRVIDLLDAAGFQRVLVETVGAGQSEVEIASVADVRVVVAAPGLGDEIQAIKAGILEIADILAVNKADNPAAEATVRHLKIMTGLGTKARSGQAPPVLPTVATTGEGVPALVDALDEAASQVDPLARARAAVAAAAMELLRAALGHGQDLDDLARHVRAGDLDAGEAAKRVLHAATRG